MAFQDCDNKTKLCAFHLMIVPEAWTGKTTTDCPVLSDRCISHHGRCCECIIDRQQVEQPMEKPKSCL